MPLAALVCASLLGLADGANPPATVDVAAEYRQAKAASGRTSDDQVRLALWCEAHGLTAERMRHLALALLADPANATARGLSGLVARDGRWVQPDSVAQAVRADPTTSALLAEYDDRRSQTPYTADAQWALGLWADDRGLKDQAKAHFTAVTRLDSGREIAWKRLGYKKHADRWMTDAQSIAARAEAEAQRHADLVWRPRLEKWKGMLDQGTRRDKARLALLGVTDPRAFRSVWEVFGGGDAESQSVAVQLLGQIEGGPATLGLANLAIRGQSAEVRRAALETLALRDPRDCVGSLVRLVQTPWKYEVRPVKGPGSVGELLVKGERFNLRRLYSPPPDPGSPEMRAANARTLSNALSQQPALVNPRGLGLAAMSRDSTENAPGITLPYSNSSNKIVNVHVGYTAATNVRIARDALATSVLEVEAANAVIRASNDPVLAVLTKITGKSLGEDHEAWAQWDTERVGHAYRSSPSEKPTFTEVPDIAYVTPLPPHASCFGAGTPVRTIDGTKLIEEVQRGDLVLAQDTTSGALSYQPVLAAFHNPPSATLRVKLDDEVIVATGIHRFWKAGKGWVMARDLKAGDPVRLLGGVAAVRSVEANPTQPVFNLEVAEGRSFFVGRLGALVHDNTLVEATLSPFDAARPREAVASAATGAAMSPPR